MSGHQSCVFPSCVGLAQVSEEEELTEIFKTEIYQFVRYGVLASTPPLDPKLMLAIAEDLGLDQLVMEIKKREKPPPRDKI